MPNASHQEGGKGPIKKQPRRKRNNQGGKGTINEEKQTIELVIDPIHHPMR
jgi:hypothetical protein